MNVPELRSRQVDHKDVLLHYEWYYNETEDKKLIAKNNTCWY